MREVSVSALKDDVFRLGAVVTRTRLFHASGLKLHSAGDILTMAQLKAMQDGGMKSVFLLEPGEGEDGAKKALTTEMAPLDKVLASDMLAEDVRAPDGHVVAAAGTYLLAQFVGELRRHGVPWVTIRKRALETLALQAKSYLSLFPPPPGRPARPDTRLTQLTERRPAAVRPLLVPRARVIVALRDEFQRAVVTNTLGADGHEALDYASGHEAAWAAKSGACDVVIVELSEWAAARALLRPPQDPPTVAVVIAAEQGRSPEVHKALDAGANDSFPLPARREDVLEKVLGGLRAMGRSVSVKPAVQMDRRKAAREGGHFVCSLTDKFVSKPLPVSSATVLDIGDGGLRIEYPAPAGCDRNAYRADSVHPLHFLYHYSKASPLGRDLTVVLPGPIGGKPLEGFARFVHVTRKKDYEVAGLVFQRIHGSVRDHMTTVRGRTSPTAVTRRF